MQETPQETMDLPSYYRGRHLQLCYSHPSTSTFAYDCVTTTTKMFHSTQHIQSELFMWNVAFTWVCLEIGYPIPLNKNHQFPWKIAMVETWPHGTLPPPGSALSAGSDDS